MKINAFLYYYFIVKLLTYICLMAEDILFICTTPRMVLYGILMEIIIPLYLFHFLMK